MSGEANVLPQVTSLVVGTVTPCLECFRICTCLVSTVARKNNLFWLLQRFRRSPLFYHGFIAAYIKVQRIIHVILPRVTKPFLEEDKNWTVVPWEIWFVRDNSIRSHSSALLLVFFFPLVKKKKGNILSNGIFQKHDQYLEKRIYTLFQLFENIHKSGL